MSAAVAIDEFRVTFAWHETVIDALSGDAAAVAAARPEVVNRFAYINAFETAQAERRTATFSPPWPPHGEQGFWERYIEDLPSLASLTGAQAWRSLVPFRVAMPVKLTPPVDEVRVWTEGLLHPWGVTLLVTLGMTVPVGVDELASRVVGLRNDDVFIADAERRTLHGPLDTVAGVGLDTLRQMAFGERPQGARAVEPFSVFTVIRGRIPGDAAVLDGGPVQRLLDAACSFSPTWETNHLDKLADRRALARSAAPSSHVVYRRTRGRAVWGPEHLRRTGPIHSLSCQHRNLALASAQTESLAGLVLTTERALHTGSALLSTHRSIAKRGVEALGRLYLGEASTYRSGSVRAQIDDNGWLTPINAVRQELELEPL